MKIAGIILILLAIGAGVYGYHSRSLYLENLDLQGTHIKKAEDAKKAGQTKEIEEALDHARIVGEFVSDWKQKFQISAAVGGGLLIIGLGLLIKGKKS